MKRNLVVAFLVLTMALVTTQTVFAARIYNFLNVKVYVTGLVGVVKNNQILLATDQRSDSLSWGSDRVTVDFAAFGVNVKPYGSGETLCSIYTFPHHEIQGGNYMTIGNAGGNVVCTICDSNHKIIQQRINTPKDTKFIGTSRYGC